MSLTREQFKNNFSIFYYILLFIVLFAFLNFTKEKLELKVLLFMGIALGFTYFLYNQTKIKEKEEKELDKGDLDLFKDVGASYFKNEQFYFDFFRKNYFLKSLNVYTWRETINHCNHFIKCYKLVDSEIENKTQLLDIAKQEKNNILNLFTSFIVGIKPGSSNFNNNDNDIHVLTVERTILKDELEYQYGEMMKKCLLLWKDNKNNSNRPIHSEDVAEYDNNINYNMDIY